MSLKKHLYEGRVVGEDGGVGCGVAGYELSSTWAGGEFMSATADSINKFCPRSGKPVVADSLTTYRGLVVGFCNQGCRDDFVANVNKRPEDQRYFDVLIKENGLKSAS